MQNRGRCEEKLNNKYEALSSTTGWGNVCILFWLPVYSRTIFKMTISWEIVGLENTFHNKFIYKHKYDHILLDVFSPR